MHLQTHLDSFHKVCVVPGVDFSRAWDEGGIREHVTDLRQEGAIGANYRCGKRPKWAETDMMRFQQVVKCFQESFAAKSVLGR